MAVYDVLLPSLSDTMAEGTIAAWLIESGGVIAAGDPLVEIETDKATMVHSIEVAGTVQTIGAEGETYPVGAVIARVGDPAELEATPTVTAAAPKSQTAAPDAAEPDGDQAAVNTPVQAFAAPTSTDVPPAPYRADGERVRASPLARRMAAAQGVVLDVLQGTGAQGRIVMADVVRAASEAPTMAAPRVVQPGAINVIGLSRKQQFVARRMDAAKTEIPEFTVTVEVDMTEVIALRGRLKAFGDDGQLVPSLNDFVLKAAAAALVAHRRVNATFIDGELHQHADVNVGFAVADGDVLVVPVIRNVDQLTLRATCAEARRLKFAVRDRTISHTELEGGTFTVSNLGMFGVSDFTAIINLPQVAILAVGGLGFAPFEIDGAPQLRRSMRLTLTSDHRVLYGAHAAEFLRTLRHALEHPELLLAG